jgi:hypothetical protein
LQHACNFPATPDALRYCSGVIPVLRPIWLFSFLARVTNVTRLTDLTPLLLWRGTSVQVSLKPSSQPLPRGVERGWCRAASASRFGSGQQAVLGTAVLAGFTVLVTLVRALVLKRGGVADVR